MLHGFSFIGTIYIEYTFKNDFKLSIDSTNLLSDLVSSKYFQNQTILNWLLFKKFDLFQKRKKKGLVNGNQVIFA